MSNSNESNSTGCSGLAIFCVICFLGIVLGIGGNSPALVIIGILLLIGVPVCVFFFKLFKAFGEIDEDDDEE